MGDFRAEKAGLVFSILIAVDLAMVPVNRLYEGRPIPEVYGRIASDPQPGAVLEIPGGYEFPSAWYNVRSMYYQTRHGRPLTVGYISRTPHDPWGFWKSIRLCERSPWRVRPGKSPIVKTSLTVQSRISGHWESDMWC
jgi:hypothetical protein